jgi:hypothetical protein
MVWQKYINKSDFYELKNDVVCRNMISLKYKRESKNRSKFDRYIEGWNNYHGKMLSYSRKMIEIEIFKIFKMV